MLQDPRSRALVDNFAGQWLMLRNLQEPHPDAGRLPELRQRAAPGASGSETELFVDSIIREDRSVHGAADRRLHVRQRAAGAALRHPERLRQPLPPRDAAGRGRGAACWARAASSRSRRIRTARRRCCAASGSSRTSSARRRRRRRPNVPALDENKAGEEPKSLRERLELHRRSPDVRQLPPRDGSAGLRARELRRHRRVARRRKPGGRIDPAGQLADGSAGGRPRGAAHRR